MHCRPTGHANREGKPLVPASPRTHVRTHARARPRGPPVWKSASRMVMAMATSCAPMCAHVRVVSVYDVHTAALWSPTPAARVHMHRHMHRHMVTCMMERRRLK